jgi:hypothetical protein
MSRNIRWAAFLFAMILSFVAAKEATAILACVNSPTMGYSCDRQGFNCACFGSGGGCSSCFHGGGGGGSSDCVYDWATGDLDCIYSN